MSFRHRFVAMVSVGSLVVTGLTVVPQAADAAVDSMPNQSQCDNGSTTYTWTGLGINRPVVASMTVDGETIADPANPADGGLGVAVCANTTGARKTGITIIRRSGSDYSRNLTGAVTPLGNAVTKNSSIRIVLSNMGDLARYFSFALVQGTVTNWTTANLGAASASLDVTVKPVDFVTVANEYNQCSATPPDCRAPASIYDGIGVYLDLDLDTAGSFSTFTGAYFAFENAIAGFAQAVQDDEEPGLSVTLGGPTRKLDGTINVGKLEAFLPDSVLLAMFGTTDTTLADRLVVTRSEGGVSSSPAFTTTRVTGGLKVSMRDITFSTPVYSIVKGSGTTDPAVPKRVDMVSSATGLGYLVAAADGGVYSYGDALYRGSMSGTTLNRPIVDMAATPTGNGYWLVADDGGVFSFGDASFKGSTGAIRLNRPIVGMASTPSGNGYWLVADDGGVFSFGDAAFYGSTGAIRLNQPVVGMAPTPSGAGYWMVASDGGVFSFGDAAFHGSTGAIRLNRPVVAMAATSTGAGYWFVADDGGVFTFGNATFHGSTGAITLNSPVDSIAVTPGGAGYWLAATDGGIFSFGTAAFHGAPTA